MSTKQSSEPRKGFPLIAVSCLLVLFTILMVILISLCTMPTQTDRLDWAEEEARANARLGLMIAIGELQRDLGPDQRISLSASILDTEPDTLIVNGVANPHWTGVVGSTYDGNQSGSPFARDMDSGGLRDARNGSGMSLRDQMLNYFVSGNEGGRNKVRGARQYQDAMTHIIPDGENGLDIVSTGSTRNPADFVRVRKVAVENKHAHPDSRHESRQNGAYAYWVTSDSIKCNIGRPDAHRMTMIDHSNGSGMQRMLHLQDTEPFVIDGIAQGQKIRDVRMLTPKTLTLISEQNRLGVLDNFHAMTGFSSSVICNVRDGGLKKNLSAFLHGNDNGGPPEIPDLPGPSRSSSIGISAEDLLVGPPNERYAALRGEDFSDTQYQDVAPTFGLLWNWANLTNEFRFDSASTGIREPKIWRDAPFRNGGANAYHGDNLLPADPRNLSKVKMAPVVSEACVYYNLATYPVGSGAERRNALRLCLYPRVGLWNPYNIEMKLDKPMILQLFLNGTKCVEFNGDRNFTREIYYGGRVTRNHPQLGPRSFFDGQYGGQIYLRVPSVTIPPGETFIFSMGGAPQELDSRSLGSNYLQAQNAPSSASYLYQDYLFENTPRANFARDSDKEPSELMPKAPFSFRERPLDRKQHGADNYMFMLKSLKNSPNMTIESFKNEPALIYANVSLQAGGGDEYPREWAMGTAANVIQLAGANDHIKAGFSPHPFTRDGFRIRWLDETAANKDSNNELFLQEAPLGNWNLRASYICRTPFDNVTNELPYFHGIYTRDIPSSEMSWAMLAPVARKGFQTGFPFGPAGFGVDRVIAFEVPTREVGIPSLGYLRHLQLSEYVWHPSYTIGASIADPRVPATGTIPAEIPGGNHGWSAKGLGASYWAQLFNDLVFYLPEENHLVFDMSFEVNHNLWSDFFLTGATPNEIANFAQDPAGNPLKNGSLRLWDRNGDPTEDLSDFFRAAGRLMIDGGFDVHSTNKEAWKAVLATTRDVGFASPNRTPFPRTLFPQGDENISAEFSTQVFTGFRSLSDQEIDFLAEAIVREVKVRAPFFGLADFVNRRLSDDETGRNGALEAALVASLPNRGLNSLFPIIKQSLPDQGPLIAEGSPQQTNLTPSDQFLKPASTGYGAPGYITQGDLLQVIGSGLVTRSDTFTVRAYGESRDVNGRVLAQAWCEAVVQRTPEPISPDEVTGLNPRVSQGAEVNFGRRFRIASFRWLHADEV